MPDRRNNARINKLFQVRITSEELGDQTCVARNISETGMFVEMPDPLPLRTQVLVRFHLPDAADCICAMAKIQNHYYFQFNENGAIRGLSGVGLRFLQFYPEAGAHVPAESLH